MKNNLTIGLAYDLRDYYLAQGLTAADVAEFDTADTINCLEAAIKSLGYKTERIGNAKALCKRLVASEKWDLVFNIAEGLSGRGRELQTPALLELYNIGYTFSDSLTCGITLDKAISKQLIKQAGLATADFAVITSPEDLTGVNLQYPLFAKPLAEGTGKGIFANSKLNSPAELKQICQNLLHKYHQPVLVEQFLPGREFTLGILGNGRKARVIGGMEIVIPANSDAIYSFDVKEQCESRVKYLPLQTSEPFYEQAAHLALQSYAVLQCRDAARVDIRLDSAGVPNFLEVNPLPGLHPSHSDLPMLAAWQNISYETLISEIIETAFSRLAETR